VPPTAKGELEDVGALAPCREEDTGGFVRTARRRSSSSSSLLLEAFLSATVLLPRFDDQVISTKAGGVPTEMRDVLSSDLCESGGSRRCRKSISEMSPLDIC